MLIINWNYLTHESAAENNPENIASLPYIQPVPLIIFS
jgi:hypothetical protein